MSSSGNALHGGHHGRAFIVKTTKKVDFLTTSFAPMLLAPCLTFSTRACAHDAAAPCGRMPRRSNVAAPQPTGTVANTSTTSTNEKHVREQMTTESSMTTTCFVSLTHWQHHTHTAHNNRLTHTTSHTHNIARTHKPRVHRAEWQRPEHQVADDTMLPFNPSLSVAVRWHSDHVPRSLKSAQIAS